jgi:lambda family phage portal protein
LTNSLIPYNLRIKLIEADLIRNPMNEPDIGKIRGGIEVNDLGAPVAYHLMKPALNTFSYDWGTWTRIPAFGTRSGRRNVLHLIDRERIGQRRGMPLLASVMEPLKQIQRLSEAELMASVISSFFTVFVKTETGESGLMEQFTDEESVLEKSDDETSMGKDATNNDDNLLELGPGTINELGENQSVDIANPQRPNEKFNDFFVAIVKQIGASIEMPFEQLMMVYQASYSASRAALLEAWKFYRMRRVWLATNFCQPVYEEWLTEAVLNGRVAAPGFFDDPLIRKAWMGTLWAGQGQGQIDPVKETKAAAMRIEKNLSTYEDEYLHMTGGDWEASMVRLARQNRKLEANGLKTSVEEDEEETPEADNIDNDNENKTGETA